MHSRPSRTRRQPKRSWLSAAIIGAALLLAVMAWRNLRIPEPKPRREPLEDTKQPFA
jgi:hypothetical protein